MARAVIPKEIIIYAGQDGVEPFTNWLNGLRNKQDLKRIQTRLLRLEQGNYGDYKSLKDGF
jgi:putative component of toxin-antitoxin plasmid stabilization module